MGNSVPILVRIDPSLRQAIEQVAHRNDRSLAAEVRRTLRREYAAESPPVPAAAEREAK
jgi:hypothetical protein